MNVEISCPECGTRTAVETDELGESLRRHNEQRHDGEAVASVAGDQVDRLAGGSA